MTFDKLKVGMRVLYIYPNKDVTPGTVTAINPDESFHISWDKFKDRPNDVYEYKWNLKYNIRLDFHTLQFEKDIVDLIEGNE